MTVDRRIRRTLVGAKCQLMAYVKLEIRLFIKSTIVHSIRVHLISTALLGHVLRSSTFSFLSALNFFEKIWIAKSAVATALEATVRQRLRGYVAAERKVEDVAPIILVTSFGAQTLNCVSWSVLRQF